MELDEAGPGEMDGAGAKYRAKRGRRDEGQTDFLLRKVFVFCTSQFSLSFNLVSVRRSCMGIRFP